MYAVESNIRIYFAVDIFYDEFTYDYYDHQWEHCKVYSIQHYVIKFVCDLRQVGGFLHQ
jgi:hypothetical protein